jgi:hypothetical protein
MPTIALLGGTGSTGLAVLRCLLNSPLPSTLQPLSVFILVRSRPRLLAALPRLAEDVESLPFKLRIVEGSSCPSPNSANDDSEVPGTTSAMLSVLSGADIILGCIGTNVSEYGLTLIQDTATSIIAALQHHRRISTQPYKPPTMIQLRTASLNHVLHAQMPLVARIVPTWCLEYIYADLRRGCDLLAAHAIDTGGATRLLDWIVVDPPAIHDAAGTVATGYELLLGLDGDKKQQSTLNYADLGVAFVEIAARRGELKGKELGVSATGKVNETWDVLSGYLMTGAKSRVWPLW